MFWVFFTLWSYHFPFHFPVRLFGKDFDIDILLWAYFILIGIFGHCLFRLTMGNAILHHFQTKCLIGGQKCGAFLIKTSARNHLFTDLPLKPPYRNKMSQRDRQAQCSRGKREEGWLGMSDSQDAENKLERHSHLHWESLIEVHSRGQLRTSRAMERKKVSALLSFIGRHIIVSIQPVFTGQSSNSFGKKLHSLSLAQCYSL